MTRPPPRWPDGKRPGANARGYTYRWQKYRAAWLQAHPLCGDRANGQSGEHSECRRANRTRPASDVDHIQCITGADDPRFWDPTNHQSLCGICHAAKTATEEGRGTPRQRIGLDGFPVLPNPHEIADRGGR